MDKVRGKGVAASLENRCPCALAGVQPVRFVLSCCEDMVSLVVESDACDVSWRSIGSAVCWGSGLSTAALNILAGLNLFCSLSAACHLGSDVLNHELGSKLDLDIFRRRRGRCHGGREQPSSVSSTFIIRRWSSSSMDNNEIARLWKVNRDNPRARQRPRESPHARERSRTIPDCHSGIPSRRRRNQHGPRFIYEPVRS